MFYIFAIDLHEIPFSLYSAEVWTQATQVDISVLPPCRSAAKRYLLYKIQQIQKEE